MTGSNDEEPVAANRDAAHWAKMVSRLKVSQVPDGATNLNVDGRQLTSPIQGFGKMWQKTYVMRLPSERVAPADLIAAWRKDFGEFWPPGNHFYAPLTGIEPGDVALLNMKMPGLKLSTGVMMLYADDESFTLMTPQGHMFAGWITFSASRQDDRTLRPSGGSCRHQGRVRGQEAPMVAVAQRVALLGDPLRDLHAGSPRPRCAGPWTPATSRHLNPPVRRRQTFRFLPCHHGRMTVASIHDLVARRGSEFGSGGVASLEEVGLGEDPVYLLLMVMGPRSGFSTGGSLEAPVTFQCSLPWS